MGKKHKGGGDHGGGGHDSAGGLRWLLTYADMITLLMAFFIMLYSISILDVEKFREMSSTFREVFGLGAVGKFHSGGTAVFESGNRSNVSVNSKESTGISPPELVNIEDNIEKYLEKLKLSGQIWVHSDERGLTVSIFNDDFLFAPGSAEMKGKGQNVLRDIARIIATIPNPVRIEGHTCNVPVSNVFFPSNWELSAARAGAVARFFIELGGVDVKRISVAGYGEHRPLVANSSDADRRVNNRTDIVLLKSIEQKREAKVQESNR